ncbi:Protein TIC 100 [Vigna angularis]|uniref:Protein TIC 100 n=1 Tax=Phaseolus angularis TaxID=3914 RepID=A0A8T0JGY0_PHAAN|nr:Protein TIC 100 [Vigna angularis]
MANDEDQPQGSPSANEPQNAASSDSDSDSDYESDYSYDEAEDDAFRRAFEFRDDEDDEVPEDDKRNNPEANLQDFSRALESPAVKELHEELDPLIAEEENPFDFPEDPENWTEQDLRELWADAVPEIGGTGWDPAWATEEEYNYVNEQLAEGEDPPIAPFYLPFRKHYPPIPDNHYDIATPKDTIEELDRIEEFLKWVSCVFEDGSTYVYRSILYEGTVWDDYAHGKGVYISDDRLIRYEGEWFQNDVEGHGVLELDIPVIEPAPGSKLEAKMRAEGRIIARDYMSPEDREWLEKDVEDMYNLADGEYEIPYYENEEWIKQFGSKPEKGRYRYAGQWKHGRMHGCGVFEVNERVLHGRFYFGEYVDEFEGCDEEISGMHAAIAEVAAAKARMFINKPDGMVREERGPYTDPQHPYFYEEDDVWMAPGFINQFYEVPDYWKVYVKEVDEEREMWLNSFYRAPLRLPMPAELEHWWSKEENSELPEFVLINKEPEPDPEDPSKLIYTEDPLILHTPTGHIINYIEDEHYGIRLFWQPPLKEGEDVDPEKAVFLPLGYDEFFGHETDKKKESILLRILLAIENACKPWLDKLDKWTEEQKKIKEEEKKELEEDLELLEAEIGLEEAVEEMERLLRIREKEEEKKAEMGLVDDDEEDGDYDMASVPKQGEEAPAKVEEEAPAEVEEEDDDDDEDEDNSAQSSFGSVDQGQTTNQPKGKPGKSPFSTLSLAFARSSLISTVPSKLQQSFSFWNMGRSKLESGPLPSIDRSSNMKTVCSVSFRPVTSQKGRLKTLGKTHGKVKEISSLRGKFLEVHSQTGSHSWASSNSISNLQRRRSSSDRWLHAAPERDLDSILSLHSSLYNFEQRRETV